MSADPSSAELTGSAASIAANRTPTGTQSLTVLALRRFIFGLLTIATTAALGWWLTMILAADGFGVVDIILLAPF
jgi:membrane glycosyltransferase